MRTDRCVAAACAVVLVCTGCLTPGKPKAKKAIGLDTSEVYRLASEALRPIADKFIERGDRVLLVPSEPFGGVPSWRFVPVPSEIPQDVFEKEIRPRVSAAFKSGGDELSLSSPESRQL